MRLRNRTPDDGDECGHGIWLRQPGDRAGRLRALTRFIGRPGTLKSPAMNEALRFVHRLEIEAAKENEVAVLAYKANINEYKLKQQVKVSLEKARMKKADSDAKKFKIELDVGEEPQEPKPRRFCTNDSSYEALGELLKDNPTGILIERDELISLIKHLDREEQVVARGFYLSGWSGRQSYSFDRIGRGHIHLDAVCLSVLGGTQPARICEYIRQACAGGAGGDGLIQRFGLLMHAIVHAADIQDRDGGALLMATLFSLYPFLLKLYADGGYQGAGFQNALRTILKRVNVEIVKRSDQAQRFVVLPKRWLVERTFAWLGRCRRLAKDWECLNRKALAFLKLASIRLMLRKLCNPR